MTPQDEEKYQQSLEFFASVKPKGWTATGQGGQGGQATTIFVQNGETQGVFRQLRSTAPKDVARFSRELNILTCPDYRHPSIVEILEKSDDLARCWYISRRGIPFFECWKSFRNQPNSSRDVFGTAINIIRQLADGLENLHDRGVVHRDIKPGNIVLEADDPRSRPILIDFGIAFVSDHQGERITNPRERKDNRGFSPTAILRNADSPRPWIDVYQLAQVLMWMLIEPFEHNWKSACHWRFVDYPIDLAAGCISHIRALTAKCSLEELSPATGGELARWIRDRIPVKEVEVSMSTFSAIAIKQNELRSVNNAKEAYRQELVESCWAEAGALALQLIHEANDLVSRCAAGGFPVTFETFPDFEATAKAGHSCRLFTIYCKGQADRNEFVICLNVKSVLYSHFTGTLVDGANGFLFLLQRGGQTVATDAWSVSIERDGRLARRSVTAERAIQAFITKGDLVKQMEDWLNDMEAWSSIV